MFQFLHIGGEEIKGKPHVTQLLFCIQVYFLIHFCKKNIYIFREFQPIMSDSNDSSLSSD